MSKLNQGGQTLVFVIATMVIALVVGVGVSLRTLSSISRISSTDTAARALAAAEGGAERYMALSTKKLDEASPPGNTCPPDTVDLGSGKCAIDFEPDPAGSDQISARAVVTVVKFESISHPDFYSVVVDKNELVEVSLLDYYENDIGVCWETIGEAAFESDLYYFILGNSGDLPIPPTQYTNIYQRGGFTTLTPSSAQLSNFDLASSSGNEHCGTIAISADIDRDGTEFPPVLRIMSMNATSKLRVIPAPGGTLPVQGFEITSIGELKDVQTGQKVERKIVVFRSWPYMPLPFQFGVFSN